MAAQDFPFTDDEVGVYGNSIGLLFDPRQLVDAALTDTSEGPTTYATFFQFSADSGRISLSFSRTLISTDTTQDLTSLVETEGSITATVGNLNVTALFGSSDLMGPYEWSPDNSAEIAVFAAAVLALPLNQRAGTVTIRDSDLDAPVVIGTKSIDSPTILLSAKLVRNAVSAQIGTKVYRQSYNFTFCQVS